MNQQPTRDYDLRGNIDEAEICLLRDNVNREREALAMIEDAI